MYGTLAGIYMSVDRFLVSVPVSQLCSHKTLQISSWDKKKNKSLKMCCPIHEN